MEITYAVEEDDWLAFLKHHASTSPTVRRSIRLNQVLGTLCLLVLFGLIALVEKSVAFAVLTMPFAILYFFFIPSHIRHKMFKQAKALISEGSNRTVLGEKHMSVTEDGIFVRSADSESKIGWSSIGRVESTGSHTFVFVSAVSALVIPRDRVLSGSYTDCVSTIRARVSNPQTAERPKP